MGEEEGYGRNMSYRWQLRSCKVIRACRQSWVQILSRVVHNQALNFPEPHRNNDHPRTHLSHTGTMTILGPTCQVSVEVSEMTEEN